MKKYLVFTVFKCLLHSVVFKVLVLLSPPTAVLLADAELLEVSPEILCRNFLPFSLKERLISHCTICSYFYDIEKIGVLCQDFMCVLLRGN